MSLLEQLFSEYGCLNHDQLNQLQVKTLRDQLKEVPSEEIASPDQARCFLSLLRAFREYVADSAKLNGENYPALLRSLLSVGEDGVYSDKLRFIFELIQNVDDCKYENAEDCTLDIHFDFNNNRIRLRYNETGFTPFNVLRSLVLQKPQKTFPLEQMKLVRKALGSNRFLVLPTRF